MSLLDLPNEVIRHVFEFTDIFDACRLQPTCRRIYRLIEQLCAYRPGGKMLDLREVWGYSHTPTTHDEILDNLLKRFNPGTEDGLSLLYSGDDYGVTSLNIEGKEWGRWVCIARPNRVCIYYYLLPSNGSWRLAMISYRLLKGTYLALRPARKSAGSRPVAMFSPIIEEKWWEEFDKPMLTEKELVAMMDAVIHT